MTNPEWAAWVDQHVTMFGMNKEDIAMVASWRSALDAYSPAELKAASIELLKLAPTFRNEHVSGLFRILGLKRAQQTKAFAAQRDDEYTGMRCSLCQQTGFVLVPHPQCVKDGEFIQGPGGYKATAAVTCSCHVGARKQQSYDESKYRPMSLHAYETSITMGWREMIEEKNGEDKARSELQSQARMADNARGKLKITR
jgi:hypothetical protein